MTTLKDRILESGYGDRVLTDVDIHWLLGGTPASRYGMVNKALKKGELIKVRRGLYVLAEKYRHKKISKFFIASRLVPHSYISLESALSYHGWIPEHVVTVTSILGRGRSREFITPFGVFAYCQLPINEYEFLTSINRIEEISEEPFLLASPLRALADYVYVKKIDWSGLEYLTNGLRIEIDDLITLDSADFVEVSRVYHSKRVLNFLKCLKKELKK